MSNNLQQLHDMVETMEGEETGLEGDVLPLAPLVRSAEERKVRAVLIAFAFFGICGGFGGVLLAIKMLKTPEKVFVLDAAGNITAGPLETLTRGSPLYTAIASQATLQFFSRGPGGLDNPELAQCLFTEPCYQKVLEDVQAEAKELETKDLRYRPEIRDFDLSVPDDHGRRILRVGGFYTVSGSVDGLALSDKREFRLTLALIPNPNFAARGMYPFVVSAFKKVVES